jgi:uncharacterized protein YjbI with pentapeptide repeats
VTVEILSPRLPSSTSPQDWPYGELEKGESYRDLNLVDVAWTHADGVTFERCRVQQCNLGGASMLRLSLDDVLVEDCDLSNVDLTAGSFRRVVIEHCRVAGLRVAQMRWQHVVLRNCQGKYLQAEKLALKGARFEQCSLLEANFDGADLGGAVFDDCDLGGATFAGAKLQGVDFRTSRLESSRVKLADLTGAILAPHQAIALFEQQTGAVVG